MHIKSTDPAFLGVKNTYLIQSQKAIKNSDKAKFLSYYYEAKARGNYLKFLQNQSKLQELPLNLDDWSGKEFGKAITIFSKMIYRKLASVHYLGRKNNFEKRAKQI